MMIDVFPLKLEYCEAVAGIAKNCLPEAWSLQGVRDVLRYDNNIFYVAKDMEVDEIVAFAGIMTIADEAELLNIAVSERYRNQGIAQQLLKQLIEDAKQQHACRMLLEVRKGNTPAQQLYKNNGFVAIGERKNYYNNPVEHAFIMEKIL